MRSWPSTTDRLRSKSRYAVSIRFWFRSSRASCPPALALIRTDSKVIQPWVRPASQVPATPVAATTTVAKGGAHSHAMKQMQPIVVRFGFETILGRCQRAVTVARCAATCRPCLEDGSVRARAVGCGVQFVRRDPQVYARIGPWIRPPMAPPTVGGNAGSGGCAPRRGRRCLRRWLRIPVSRASRAVDMEARSLAKPAIRSK